MPSWGQQGPSISSLWSQARDEHPDDEAARRARYTELMREAGYIVKRCAFVDDDGRRCELPEHKTDGHSFDPPTLPCGYPLRGRP